MINKILMRLPPETCVTIKNIGISLITFAFHTDTLNEIVHSDEYYRLIEEQLLRDEESYLANVLLREDFPDIFIGLQTRDESADGYVYGVTYFINEFKIINEDVLQLVKNKMIHQVEGIGEWLVVSIAARPQKLR